MIDGLAEVACVVVGAAIASIFIDVLLWMEERKRRRRRRESYDEMFGDIDDILRQIRERP